tara:strand:+ start:471 stop:707 length:237 start_codon:yes stop_codon:yes gene_type:complete
MTLIIDQQNMMDQQEVIDRYVEKFGTYEDVSIFNMPSDDSTTKKFIEVLNQSINSGNRIDRENLEEVLNLTVPEGVLI